MGLVKEAVSLTFKDLSGVVRSIATAPKSANFRIGSDGPGSGVVVKSVSQAEPGSCTNVEVGWELTHVNGNAVDSFSVMELDDTIYGSCTRPFLYLQSLLDVVDDFRVQLPILRCYFGVEYAPKEAKARALAQAAAEVMNKPEKADELVPVVGVNLQYAEPLPSSVKLVLQRLLLHIDKWQFNTTGRVDNPPTLTDPKGANFDKADANLHVTQEDMHRIQAVLWIQYPTKFHTPMTMIGLTGALLRHTPSDPQPVATFFSAVQRKHNLIFGGTGKDKRNTCGRVTARLRQANYKVYYAIVLCSFETCLARIDKRFQETGRNVPTPILRSLFEGLQKSVPYYIENLKDLGDGILIYNNDQMTGKLEPIHLRVNDSVTEALQLVNGLLALPPLESAG